MLFSRFLFALVTNLPILLCTLSAGKMDSNSFLFENGRLTVNCLSKEPSDCLAQLTTYQPIKKLYLEGFVFDEINVKQFSDTICELQELTLYRCDINDELASLLTLPSSLNSIQLERLNLSVKGIQKIVDKLSVSFESLEVVDCLANEIPPGGRLVTVRGQKESLDFSRFSRLKNICIDNLTDNVDSYNLLLSLTRLPLEIINLPRIDLNSQEWSSLLKEWKTPNGVAFSNTLKKFDLDIIQIEQDLYSKLIRVLFSFSRLEIISLYSARSLEKVSLPPLPLTIRQLSLESTEKIYLEDGKTSFYNSNNLSKLTHLDVYYSFKISPYDLFDFNQLEYLKIRSWGDSDCYWKRDRCCPKLKYLSIFFKYLNPFLANFQNNFPVIETLDTYWASSEGLDSHLKSIISSKTLKCLKIDYTNNTKSPLKIEGVVKSSIEKLELRNVHWEFVSSLLDVELFPSLKTIHIETSRTDLDLDLNEVLEKLSSFPQLTSLILIGNYFLPNEQVPFTFENLKFFYFEVDQKSLDLNNLLCCMPNLIELRLEKMHLSKFMLQNSVGIRYLTLPSEYFQNYHDFINIYKNIPYLIQLKTRMNNFASFKNAPFAPELAYYFKKLKEHFKNEFQFEISPNCFPIEQFNYNVELLKLVRLKSPELTNYLNEHFPFDTSESFIKQLFTIKIEKQFDIKMVKVLFNLLRELEVTNEKDTLLIQKLFLQSKDQHFAELNNCSSDNFYKIFSGHLSKSTRIYLKPAHSRFVENFYKQNKKYGPTKILKFLNSFFTFLSVADSKSKIYNLIKSILNFRSVDNDGGRSRILSDKVFDFFSGLLLAPSFCSLFDKIKENKLSKKEKKYLPFKFELIATNMKDLEPKEYEELSSRFKDIFIELCDESFDKSFFEILKIVSTTDTTCSICLDSLFTKECKFFKAKEGNCHLYHKECLNGWLEQNNTCPVCRRSLLPFTLDS